jgi:polysaccharide biosynthesis/export protein
MRRPAPAGVRGGRIMPRGLAHGVAWALGVAACLAGGCASSAGNRFVLFPAGHRLIEPAKTLRESNFPPPDLPRELNKTVAPPYVVEPGDVLLVQPTRLDSPVRLPGDQPILPDGSIQLGEYGRLVVAGKTIEQIESEVNGLIKARTADAGPITVRLVVRDSKVYYVLGEVNAPGSFQLRGRETVLDGIVAAGGLTTNAARSEIILARPSKPGNGCVVLPVCYNEIVQLGSTVTNYQLQAGDRIFVPSRGFCEELFGCLKKEQGPCSSLWDCGCGGPPHEAGPAPHKGPSPAPPPPPAPAGGPDPLLSPAVPQKLPAPTPERSTSRKVVSSDPWVAAHVEPAP